MMVYSPMTGQTPAPKPAASSAVEAYRELFEISMKDKKGVQIYMQGQTLGVVVTHIASDYIEARSREYSRVVIRLDRIDAAALN